MGQAKTVNLREKRVGFSRRFNPSLHIHTVSQQGNNADNVSSEPVLEDSCKLRI